MLEEPQGISVFLLKVENKLGALRYLEQNTSQGGAQKSLAHQIACLEEHQLPDPRLSIFTFLQTFKNVFGGSDQHLSHPRVLLRTQPPHPQPG